MKTKTDGNDSAYAVFSDSYASYGLTKREYFAAMVLQGLMANPERYKYIADAVENDGMPQALATQKNANKAVYLADALIEALNK